MPRNRAVAVVLQNNNLLVMYRKNTREYYTFPGGGIEPSETTEQAVARETLEETSISVKINKLLYVLNHTNGDTHYYYLCTYLQGKPKVQKGTNEYKDNLIGENVHKPMWIPIDQINDIVLYPEEATMALLKDIREGFNNSPRYISTR